MMRNMLIDWHKTTTRKLAKQRKVGSAVMHAWMSLLRYTMHLWIEQVAEARTERQATQRALARFVHGSKARAWRERCRNCSETPTPGRARAPAA